MPCRPTGEESRWTWSKEKVKKESSFLIGAIVNKGTENEKWDIFRKNYLVNEKGEVRKSKVKSIWNEKEINYQNGGAELKNIINAEKFSYPKPLFLLTKILSISTREDSTILDFFAGSGTTLHATLQLNSEDGGGRKCILVTNNENKICEEVTYVRNKQVIQGYTTPTGEDVPGLTSNTLRYYRTDFVPREKTQKNMRALVAAATDMLCIKNDIYTETHEIGGAKMRPSLARHFKTGNNEMLIIYDDRAIPYIVDKLKDIDVKEPIMVYVFSPNDYPYTDEFFEVADKVKLCALPAAIYETYSKVLKRPKPHFLDEEKEKMVEAEKEDELDELFTTIDEEGGEA